MHYICIEDNKVISVLNYEPSVPSTITVVTIADEDHNKIQDQTHYFDIVTKRVLPVATEIVNQKAIDLNNAVELEFLSSTDWKVLRHIRQTALGVSTSLSQQEYLALEQQRADAAARII